VCSVPEQSSGYITSQRQTRNNFKAGGKLPPIVVTSIADFERENGEYNGHPAIQLLEGPDADLGFGDVGTGAELERLRKQGDGGDDEDSSDGKAKGSEPSITRFEVLGSNGPYASVLRMTPLTGHHHQIRLHSAALGCPILADPTYGWSFIGVLFRANPTCR
jgi:hypothetical protein